MPLYEYECDVCAHRFERIQKFSDPLVDICPSCGGHVRKLLSSPAIQFKGTGFYINDYAKKSASDSGKGDAPKGESKSSDSKSSESKSSESKSSESKSSESSSGSSDSSASSASTATKAESKSESKAESK
jgi:putative FmdB family regulatory protein